LIAFLHILVCFVSFEFTALPGLSSCVVMLTKTQTSDRSDSFDAAAQFCAI